MEYILMLAGGAYFAIQIFFYFATLSVPDVVVPQIEEGVDNGRPILLIALIIPGMYIAYLRLRDKEEQ